MWSFSGHIDAKCAVLCMSNLEEVRVSYNTSCVFPWENGLLSYVFLIPTSKRNKGLEFPGVLPGSVKPGSVEGNQLSDIRLGNSRLLCRAPCARSARCSRSGVEMASA